MANSKDPNLKPDEATSFCFIDFPEDVQVCILSFLCPADIAAFSCTSKRFVLLCKNDKKLWYAMCDRRWGSKTQIQKWGDGKITYKLLYETLDEWENLIGFWRRCGRPITGPPSASPPLIFFEWGPRFLTGSRVSSPQNGAIHLTKTPFLWLGISREGQILNFLDPNGETESKTGFDIFDELWVSEQNLVPVNVNFMGSSHVLVEENQSFAFLSPGEKRNGYRRSSSSSNLGGYESEEVVGADSAQVGSLPDRLVSDFYQHFANKTSPGADRRRQRRKEKERQGRRKWEPEHFIKVVDSSPDTDLRDFLRH